MHVHINLDYFKIKKSKTNRNNSVTLWTLTSVCIFSIQFSIHFLGVNKENFKIQDLLQLLIISFILVIVIFKSETEEKNFHQMLVPGRGQKGKLETARVAQKHLFKI